MILGQMLLFDAYLILQMLIFYNKGIVILSKVLVLDESWLQNKSWSCTIYNFLQFCCTIYIFLQFCCTISNFTTKSCFFLSCFFFFFFLLFCKINLCFLGRKKLSQYKVAVFPNVRDFLKTLSSVFSHWLGQRRRRPRCGPSRVRLLRCLRGGGFSARRRHAEPGS